MCVITLIIQEVAPCSQAPREKAISRIERGVLTTALKEV
jgi:hypothetical protein